MKLHEKNSVTVKWLGIDTYKEAVIYMNRNCHVCRSEGFEVQSQIQITFGNKSILAVLNHIDDHLLGIDDASLSKYAWEQLDLKEGDTIFLSHPLPTQSLKFIRSKVYGHELNMDEMKEIISDISQGHYSDIHLATFLTACAGNRLSEGEIINLTKAMVQVGNQLSWPQDIIVDKHSVGGLPGNRTSLIVVPIVSAFGLTMPKTSSRAITSPAGTADTMETLAPVELDLKSMKKVVEKEGGCLVWGGSVSLSPADDFLVRIERIMDLDSEGQLIASVLSKKIAAGSTHVVIDVPIGLTAKVRSKERGEHLEYIFNRTAHAFGLNLKVICSDGNQPVGRGIGPALEAKDVLAVLRNEKDAPHDLRERALMLAGHILEFSPRVSHGNGLKIATDILNSGKAWNKFLAICNAQGGFKEPPSAPFHHVIESSKSGKVVLIDNRNIAKIAKLAGAPNDKVAGVVLHTPLGTIVEVHQPLFTIYADSKGQLDYAISFLTQIQDIIRIEHTA